MVKGFYYRHGGTLSTRGNVCNGAKPDVRILSTRPRALTLGAQAEVLHRDAADEVFLDDPFERRLIA
ncbi:hypothetical protein GCM10011614_20120 [Novosphingobium colocasiae]|uniref:Uncharacterized protein n=1 Tax=Novosphingobium colocasiae TaxID=1256513 RepID=A0A918PEY8_9SPHN|nr:hypothetical protein GCM10011614_20120 [Novosphingobium colocasiae]